MLTKGGNEEPEFSKFSSSESKTNLLPQTDVYTV